MARILLWLAFVLGAACSDRTLTVELVRVAPDADPMCGAPTDARAIVVTALGDFPTEQVISDGGPITEGESFTITGIPVDARVLWVNVIGDVGLRAIGKTAPFTLDELDDGDPVPVFMAPPEGLCPTGPPNFARAQPIAARAGTGVLIGGGFDRVGASVLPVERYDASTGRFEVIADNLYGQQLHGLLGATMTTLPASDDVGERVVIAGGSDPGYQVYDAGTGEFSRIFLLNQGRAHHAALALDAHRVMLAGGCGLPLDDDDAGLCIPLQLLSSITIINVTTGEIDDRSLLSTRRIDPILLRETTNTALLLGGVDDEGTPVPDIERIFLDGRPSELIASPAGLGAALAGGGIFSGFASAGDQPRAGASVLPPQATGMGALVPVADAPSARAGATLTPLQDGRILVFGGDMADTEESAMLYEPNPGQFRVLDTSGRRVRDHAAVRLQDGSVLIVGGREDGDPMAEAWIVRPDLTGPFARDVTISFGDDNQDLVRQIIPSDPGQAAPVSGQTGGDVAHYLITASRASADAPSEWAVIAGPMFSRLNASLSARTSGGGMAVLIAFRDPDNYSLIRLLPEQDAALIEIEAGEQRAISGCDASAVTAPVLGDGGASVSIEIARTDDALTVAIEGAQVLACDGLDAPHAGLLGVGVIGEVGSSVRVDGVTARR